VELEGLEKYVVVNKFAGDRVYTVIQVVQSGEVFLDQQVRNQETGGSYASSEVLVINQRSSGTEFGTRESLTEYERGLMETEAVERAGPGFHYPSTSPEADAALRSELGNEGPGRRLQRRGEREPDRRISRRTFSGTGSTWQNWNMVTGDIGSDLKGQIRAIATEALSGDGNIVSVIIDVQMTYGVAPPALVATYRANMNTVISNIVTEFRTNGVGGDIRFLRGSRSTVESESSPDANPGTQITVNSAVEE
jgi:hypothetical protein